MSKRWLGLALLCGACAGASAALVQERLEAESDWLHDITYEREDTAAEGTLKLRLGDDPAFIRYFEVPVEVWAERIADLAPYQVNGALMEAAGSQCRFMHCLPSYHDLKTQVGREMGAKFGRDCMEVTDDVFNGPQSIVFDEAENRMHTIKAVMAEMM